MTGPSAMYGIAAVERMTGVPAGRIRQWHEAEGQGSPAGPSGVMLYSRDDIESIVAFADAGAPRRSPPPPSPGPPSSAEQPEDQETRLLILLAERDEYAAELAEYFLRTEGYVVETVFDAAEALRRYEQVEPDLTIVELLLDGGAGFELCNHLCSLGRCPVVAVSALDPQGHPALHQVDAVLRKPVAPLTLVSTVRDLLGTSAILRHSES